MAALSSDTAILGASNRTACIRALCGYGFMDEAGVWFYGKDFVIKCEIADNFTFLVVDRDCCHTITR